MDEIGKFLGYLNPATTAKFYANLSVQETVDCMNTGYADGTDEKKDHAPEVPKFKQKEKKKKSKFDKIGDLNIGGVSIKEEKLEKVQKSKK